ncbi:MAG TPA: PilZ domain-containing protein [Novosphingobium sp.]|nr:PilZ domain-containing protein [Novosphingobium sp.]HZV09161.1 PilZ domain-containing protein [Novosphingobium sp.]
MAGPDSGALLPPGAEHRGAQRFTLLVRTAKLVIDGREYLCVLRDASNTGVKVRLFHPLPAQGQIALELGSGERYPMELVWQTSDHAGFRFLGDIDVHRLIEDKRDQYPKRQIRMRLGCIARLVAHGHDGPVLLRDISQQGACIETGERLMLRQPVRLEAEGFPPVHAKVCWRHQPRYGLVFEKGFSLEELALHLARLHAAAPATGAVIDRYAG